MSPSSRGSVMGVRLASGILSAVIVASTAILLLTAPNVRAQPHPYSLDYSSYLGGSLFEQTRDAVTDICGNVYITGGTQSANFPTTPGANDTTHNGWMDVFVAKLNRRGDLIWSTYLGGPNYDRAYAIELDAQGYVYVGGRAGDGFPTSPGVLQPTFAGDTSPGAYGLQDGFVAKLTPDGSQIVWATYFGGPGSDFLRDIDVDDAGSVYLGVAGANQNNPHITPGAFDTLRNGQDAMIARITQDATGVVFASYVGGSGNDGGAPTIRYDDRGNAYLLSNSDSDDAPVSVGAYQTTRAGGQDMNLVKFNSTGTFLWGTYFGGSGGEGVETHHLAIDPFGNPVMAAFTSSSDIPTNVTSVQPIYGGNGDAFIARISADGSSLLGATYIGGSAGDGPEGTSIDVAGDIYISGSTGSTNFPVTPNARQPASGGGGDMFGLKISLDLTELRYSTYYGGSGDDAARSSTIWQNRSFILVGQTSSANFPLLNPYQGAFGGGAGDNGIVYFLWWDNPPVADAGTDQTVPKNALVTLDGTGSYEPDGDCLFFSWMQTAGPVVTLAGATTATPTFIPSVPGAYTFELTVDDCRTFVTDAVNVYVTGMPPNAMLAVNPSYLFVGQPAEVTANGSSDSDGLIVTYNFTFGDANGTGDTAISYVAYAWTMAGNYTVEVRVTDDDWFTDKVNVTVQVVPPGTDLPPTAVISVTPATTGNLSTVFTFDATGSWDREGPITAYLWDFGDMGTATTAIAPHAYAARGDFAVTLTVWDMYGWNDTDTVTVSVLNRPPIAYAGADATTPKRTPIILDGTSSSDPDSDAIAFLWRQTSGPQAYLSGYGTATPSVLVFQSGQCVFSLTVTDTWGSSSVDMVSLIVTNSLPIAFASQDRIVPKNSPAVVDGLQSSDPDGDAITYSWAQTAGPTVILSGGGTAVASATLRSSGLYTFRLTVTDEEGAQDMDEVTLTVFNNPPVITASTPSTATSSVESGSRAVFAAVAHDPDGDVLSYSWKVDGQPTGSDSPLLDFNAAQPGIYTVNVTVSDGEAQVWREWRLTVTEPPAGPGGRTADIPWWLLLIPLGAAILVILLLWRKLRKQEQEGKKREVG